MQVWTGPLKSSKAAHKPDRMIGAPRDLSSPILASSRMLHVADKGPLGKFREIQYIEATIFDRLPESIAPRAKGSRQASQANGLCS